MQTLDRAIRGIEHEVPVPFGDLGNIIKPGPGHVILLLGATGVGKSAMGLLWALRLSAPTLIVSLDTDLTTQAARTASALTGVPMPEIKNDLPRWGEYLRTRKDLPMMVDYPIFYDDVGSVLASAEEFYGQAPALAVIDNLGDIVKDESYEGHRAAIRELRRAGNRFGTAIVVLHHLNRKSGGADGDAAIRVSDGEFYGEKIAPIVLGAWRVNDSVGHKMMRVAVLKNRFGPMDSSGRTVYADLEIDLNRMKMG